SCRSNLPRRTATNARLLLLQRYQYGQQCTKTQGYRQLPKVLEKSRSQKTHHRRAYGAPSRDRQIERCQVPGLWLPLGEFAGASEAPYKQQGGKYPYRRHCREKSPAKQNVDCRRHGECKCGISNCPSVELAALERNHK